MTIKKVNAIITNISDLTPTAKEVTLQLEKPLDFIPGSFINVFMEIDGEKVRRAYSISSSQTDSLEITITVRLNKEGKMTPLFWKEGFVGTQVEIMGPLGLNTFDKMKQETLYLFAFGIGAGVVKSLAQAAVESDHVKKLVIVTGSRNQEDVLYKDFFDSFVSENNQKNKLQENLDSNSDLEKVSKKEVIVDYVLSQGGDDSLYKKGYIQHHIDLFDYNNSDVFVCGQETACEELVSVIKTKNPIGCEFFVEGFH